MAGKDGVTGRRDDVDRTPFAGLTRRVRGQLALTPLRAFNALVPKDAGSRLIAGGIRFAPGKRGLLDLYGPRPRAAGGPPLPVVIWFYGGAWSSGERQGYRFVARALAAHGFVVVVPDYRLLPEVRYPEFLEDNAAALSWVRANILAAAGGDPDRIVLAGHSAGAYNAAMLALDRRWLGDERRFVRGWAGLAGPYDFLPLSGAIAEGVFGEWPHPAETQPIAHVARGAPPALLASGTLDRVVESGNAARLAARLRACGVPVEEHRYPGVAHTGLVTAIARPLRRRAPVLADLAAFALSVTAAPEALRRTEDSGAAVRPPDGARPCA